MAGLNIVLSQEADFRQRWDNLRAKLSLESQLLNYQERLRDVKQIIKDVQNGGDGAVIDRTFAYDGIEFKSGNEFRIPEEQLHQAHNQLDDKLLEALRSASGNVRDYQEKIKSQSIADWSRAGMRLGLRYRPIKRVGICVPAGSAPLVSTVIMTVVPAQVAGVEEIAVISAPRADCNNSIYPGILGTCYELGVKEVYRISGAQAVAALALGTETIKKVDKIVGPSSWWGQLAKKELYGLIDIDSFAGPSEVLIIADDTANPQWLAADMLSQAEHAPGSAVLVTDSEPQAQEVARKLDEQLRQLDRKEGTAKCLEQFCLAVVTRDIDAAVELANEFAPEHLQIQCKDGEKIAERIENAGAIFIGEFTPVATGDYFAGPSHTLPTGGSARFFSALSVNDFLKQSSVISFDRQSLAGAAEAIGTIARSEGLDAHARSVKIRLEND